jgi:hypothetical protein
MLFASLFTGLLAASLGSTAGCGGSGGSGFGGVDGGSSSGGGGSSGGSGGSGSGSGCGITGCSSGGSGSGSSSGGTPVACPSGLQCNVSCPNNGTTSISGIVYDPAGTNPLYDIAVYVPATALQPLPAGVPTGAAACNCGALFQSGAVVSTVTGVDGSFKLTNVPVGNVPLVLQVGKWRREVQVTTSACTDTQPSMKLTLPGTLTGAGPNDNMPDIAVSTGSADTLECLMSRIGIPASEYVNGSSGSGHVHLFSGGGTGGGGGGGAGRPESPGWGAPASDTNLWDTQAHLMPYDILLLSCEGGETYDANPPILEDYLNAGGRAFASHYHYAWFSGPIDNKKATYSAPSDWGANLATWSDSQGANQVATNGKIVQTLNGSTSPFPKGQALYQWLGLVNALGVNGAPTGDINIQAPRYNAVVGPNDKPSQPWIDDVSSNFTLYFSFDTPVGGQMPLPTDGGAPNYCGRAVFSDLHVSGSAATEDPSGTGGGSPSCSQRPMLPQEKALEFMLFDLSSCVIPDTETPPTMPPGQSQ